MTAMSSGTTRGRLLPTAQAAEITEGLTNYLKTTFALADSSVQKALDSFLTDPQDGIFKGPFIRTRTPFKPAPGGADSLDIAPGKFDPYGHQSAAFARLSTKGLEPHERPRPTLATTGTGSGKTESFLYPILDHVVRHKRRGGAGISALILYPMNALAVDQAQRLADMITADPELGSVRAAMYVGDTGDKTRRVVTAEGLINDRSTIRDNPPDILLTNYKMLDQLLLRSADQKLWSESALSLQYLVLDEFHTYDGAQGTDVAMLLRRLGIKLKSHWPSEHPAITDEHRRRPLGRITPVATSATLGDEGNPGSLLHFARTVFGEEFPADSVITESRYPVKEWCAGTAVPGVGSISDGDELNDVNLQGEEVSFSELDLPRVLDDVNRGTTATEKALIAVTHLFTGEVDANDLPGLLDLLKTHSDIEQLAVLTQQARHIDELTSELLPHADHDQARQYLSHLIAALSVIRAEVGRAALTIDVHMWIRELTRIDRVAGGSPEFRWFDDGDPVTELAEDWDDNAHRSSFPAVYCRNCGRSGWAVLLAPIGFGLAPENKDANIRREHVTGNGKVRALISAEGEADVFASTYPNTEAAHPLLRAFDTKNRTVDPPNPAFLDHDQHGVDVPAELEEARMRGGILPVLMQQDDEKSKIDTCPACNEKDSIRFLGSAIATMLSVTLTTMFGDEHLGENEKKSLVFTDSVQDAAHRAGFIEARSHTLTLRNVIADAVPADGITLDRLGEAIVDRAGEDSFHRFRMLPPEFTGDRFPSVQRWWRNPDRSNQAGRRLVARRLGFDATLEFGLQSRIGRTLEMTGTVNAEVVLPPADELDFITRGLFEESKGVSGYLGDGDVDIPSAEARIAWVHGVVEHLRTQGAIHHEWLDPYIKDGGRRYRVWGGRRRDQGMPAFPQGRSAPRFAMTGRAFKSSGRSAESLFDPFEDAGTWFARYTGRMLGVLPSHGAALIKQLFTELTTTGILRGFSAKDGAAKVFGLPAERVCVRRTATEDSPNAPAWFLECDVCTTRFPVSERTQHELAGTHCLLVQCSGRLRESEEQPNFYRNLYTSTDMRRVVAREHSSILTPEARKEFEDGFKTGGTDASAPNVLVATPTLEMGIDIGDLSTVVLAGLPATVASYVQRVGRAGRLTGNALDLAFVTGRGETLPKLGDPTSVINGAVQPPATYLDAVEIIKRQYFAYIIDRLADSPDGVQPSTPMQALGKVDTGSFLDRIIAENEQHYDEMLNEFLGSFGDLVNIAETELRAWADPTSDRYGLRRDVWNASAKYTRQIEDLRHRLHEVREALPELEQLANNEATASEDDKRAHQAAVSAKSALDRALIEATTGDRKGGYWISMLESAKLLPNYTLLDESVALDIALRWREEDSGDYKNERIEIERGAKNALRDFAPGSTFYGRGLEVRIDALELGPEKRDVYTLSYCTDCGYTHDSRTALEPTVAECPRCHSTGIADRGQQVQAVELRKVNAIINRDESRISDRDDDRTRRSYSFVSTADIDPEGVQSRWYVDGYGFGVTYLKSVRIITTNFGPRAEGSELAVAGELVNDVRFRVCGDCGQLDTSANTNSWKEHRPWCPRRKSFEEDTVNVVLTHQLETQGALLRLPAGLIEGENAALPSLEAAIRLGLREHLGGDPAHIDVIATVEPQPEGGTVDALLLHDTVPGGTGYLADLTNPETLWGILWAAYEIVRECECREQGRLACQKCILPYINRDNTGLLSRSTAERKLEELLVARRKKDEALAGTSGSEDQLSGQVWTVTDVPPEDIDPESYLERTFRKVFLERLEAMGMYLTEKPTPRGTAVQIQREGSKVQWTLEPQEDMGGVRPDFVLRANTPQIPVLAIFTDGKTYHATPAHNRIADDVHKRRSIAKTSSIDTRVIAITKRDVEQAAESGKAGAVPRGQADRPEWYADHVAQALPARGLKWSSDYAALMGNPVQLLLEYVDRMSANVEAGLAAVRAVAEAVPFFFLDGGVSPQQATFDGTDDLAEATTAIVLRRRTPASPGGQVNGVVVGRGSMGLAMQIEVIGKQPVLHVAVVLDDREDGMLSDEFDQGWREWLHLSNLLGFRGPAADTEVTSVRYQQGYLETTAGSAPAPGAAAPGSRAEAAAARLPAPLAGGLRRHDIGEPPHGIGIEFDPAWNTVFDQALDDERPVLVALASAGIQPVPEYGEELDDGIPALLSWPEQKVALIDLHPVEEDRQILIAAGWTVVGTDPAEVKAAVEGAGGGAEEKGE